MTNEEQLNAYLNELDVHTLRSLARRIGVYGPTTKIKTELIDGISDIVFKRAEAVAPSKRGAPVKDHDVDFSMLEKVWSFATDYVIPNTENKVMGVRFASSESVYDGATFSGILCYENEPVLVGKTEKIPFPHTFIHELDLREGDFIVCLIGYVGNELSIKKILSVNLRIREKKWNRRNFKDFTGTYPNKSFSLDEKEDVLRAIDFFAPIGYGQRIECRIYNKTNRVAFLEKLLKRERQEKIIFLNTSVSMEEQTEIIATFPESEHYFITSLTEEENKLSILRMVSRRVQRICEEGDSIILVLNSLNGIMRISESLCYELFSLARHTTENDITVLGFTSKDEMMNDEISSLANCVLDFKLSINATLEPLYSYTKREEKLREEEIVLLSEQTRQNEDLLKKWYKSASNALFLEENRK